MKFEQKALSRKLRSEGKSIKEIRDIVQCSQSSVSSWVRDIMLTPEQEESLKLRNPAFNPLYATRNPMYKKYEKIKEISRKEGSEKAKHMNPLHASGCMLYWGEGTKSKNRVKISNSNPALLNCFLKFLYEFFNLCPEDITMSINCYTDIKNLEEIEAYWLKELNLDRKSLRKGTVNYFSCGKHNMKAKSPFGTCTVEAKKSSKIVQHIYGAIDQYAKIFAGCNGAGLWPDVELRTQAQEISFGAYIPTEEQTRVNEVLIRTE